VSSILSTALKLELYK